MHLSRIPPALAWVSYLSFPRYALTASMHTEIEHQVCYPQTLLVVVCALPATLPKQASS